MKQALRRFILFVMLVSPVISFGQTQTHVSSTGCPGVPGACGYPANSNPAARSGPNVSPQNGNGTLGVIYDQQKCGLDFTAASQRLGKRFSPAGVNQPAPFVISGIPACAVIEKAYLWAEGSGNGAAQTATVNGPLGSANYPMSIVGQGPDKCWGYSGTYTYRADVTASVNGNGTYNISGILTNPPTSGNDMDGATLLVIWSVPSANFAGRIIIADGAYVVNGGIANYNMPISPAVCGATTGAKAFLCVGDIQFNPTSWTLNGTAGALSWNWWDYVQVNTTVAAAATTSNFNVNTGGDCFNLSVTGLYFRTTTCMTCPTTTALTTTTSSTPASCSACNGTASVTVSPAGSYTYSWSPAPGGGQGTANATGLCAGVYSVTITSACTTVTATVNVASSGGSITVNNTGQTNVTCNGQCTGSTTLTVTGGTAPYTFTWSPAVTNSTVGNTNTSSGLCAGTYTVNCMDAGGCTGSTTVTITQPPPVTFTQSQVNVTCNSACNGTASVVASGGTGTYTYNWSPAPGGGQGTANATGLCAGTYSCTITSGPATCSTVATFTITQPPAITFTQSQVNVTCNSACNGTASVVASGGTGTYTYNWSPAPGGGQGTANATGLCAGTYSCTITSGPATCSTVATFTITQPPAITFTQSQTNVSCNGGCNGTASVVASGGSGTYTYNWSPAPGGGQGTANATGLCAGNYTCTITSGPATCTINATFSITQPPALTATSSSVPATCGNPNGSATVTPSGGAGSYTYSWAPVAGSGPTLSNIPAGAYTCTIGDANSCTITVTVNVTNAGSPTVTVTSFTNVTCFGACNGTATVTASGGATPYTYTWAPAPGGGQGTASVTGLCPGTYTCTVSDANSCQATATVTITQPPQITATQSQTNVTCNSACDGTASVVAAGGTGTYTYNWAPAPGGGQGTANATGLCAGTYTCTISSGPATCTISATFTITQPPAITFTQSQTNVSCNGGCNGTASVVASGGTGTYTYNWSPAPGGGQGTANATGLCAGNYTCTITSGPATCTINATFSITQPPALTATSSSVPSTCGNPNGSATVTPSGGAGSYTYSWAPVAGSGPTLSNIPAGAYTCTIGDANNCTITVTVNVSNTGAPTATISSFTNVTCFGACDGTATVTVTGGTSPYTYSWAPAPGGGQGTPTATGLCPGTYTCTVTDANSCLATATVTITQPPQITATQSQTNVTCNSACDGTASVVASGGTGTYTYNWSPAPGGGQGTANATGLCAGTYSCTISSGPSTCTISVTFTITQPPALSFTQSQTNVTCNNACDGTASVVAAGGTGSYTYTWSPTPGGGQGTANATGLCAGTYSCVIADAAVPTCTIVATFTITQPPALTATTSFITATCGNSNGSAIVTPSGGTGPYTYNWSPVAGTNDTLANIPQGAYTCTIGDFNNCTITVTVNVPNAGSPTVTLTSFTNVTCFGACDGTADVTGTGGTGTYSYNWVPAPGGGQGTANVTGLCPGTYTCTISDGNGCTDTASVIITEPPQLTTTGTQTDVTCFAACNGTADVTVTGGTGTYTYNWSPAPGGGQGTPNATGLCAGTYTCTVTDSNSCTVTATFTITEPTQLTLAAAGFNVTCFGACDGQVVVIPSGGTPPYSFSWSTGCTTASCNNICAGSYTVTVTDLNGCTATASVTVTEPTDITVTTTTIDAHCNQPDGSASATFSGGTGTLTPVWYNPQQAAGSTYSNIPAGNYFVVVTDQNGCDDTASVTINNLPGVTASAGPLTNVSCFGGNNGSFNVLDDGINAPYTYSWTCSSSTTSSATGLSAGSCTVTLTDAAGCTSSVSFTITEPPQLSVTASATPGAICAGQNIQMSGTTAGGTPVYQYAWNPGQIPGLTQTITPAVSGTYTLYVVDANNCVDSSTVNITVNSNPVALLSGDTLSGCAPLCVDFSDMSTIASGTITGWSWDFGDGNTSTSQNPTNCYQQPGPYTVILTVTTSAGCTNTIVMPNYINVFSNPVAEFTAGPQPTTELNPTIYFTDQSNGATTWSWSFGDLLGSASSQQNPAFTYPGPGCYDVLLTVSTNNGCEDTTMHRICIDPDVTLFVPNAFTPNGDGMNEVFRPEGVGIDPENYELWIFDRWGNQIFYTDDWNKGWDGHVQGSSEVAQIDTYVWRVKAKDFNGGSHNLLGKVSLIK